MWRSLQQLRGVANRLSLPDTANEERYISCEDKRTD